MKNLLYWSELCHKNFKGTQVQRWQKYNKTAIPKFSYFLLNIVKIDLNFKLEIPILMFLVICCTQAQKAN